MYVRLLLALLCVLGCATLVDASPFAYVAIYNGQRVAVVDTTSNSKIKDVLLPGSVNPYGVAVNSFGSRVYVSDRMGTKIFVIDTSDDSVKTFNVSYRSSGLAVNAAGTRLFVAHPENAKVSVLNAVDGTVLMTVATGTSPQGVAVKKVSSSVDRVYIANSALGAGDPNHYISVYDYDISNGTNGSMTSAGTANVDSAPMGVAVNPAGTRLYVACSDSGTVNVVDISNSNNQTVGTVNVGTIPLGVAVNPTGSLVYVTLSGSDDKVAIIDTTKNEGALDGTISVGRSPMGISITPDGARIVAANSLSASAALVNSSTNTVVATVSVEKTAGDNSNPQSLGNFAGPELVPVNFPVPFNGTVTPADPITINPDTNVALAPKGRDLPLLVVPDVNFVVGNIYDGSTPLTSPYKLTNVVGERTISANFIRVSRTIKIQKAGTGSGTIVSTTGNPAVNCGTTCSSVENNYAVNSVLELSAQAAPGSIFQGWAGAGCNGIYTCFVTVNGIFADLEGNYLIQAYFTPSQDSSMQAAYDAASDGGALDLQQSYSTEPSNSFNAGAAKTVTLRPAATNTTVTVSTASGKFTVQYGMIVIGGVSGTNGSLIIK